MCTFHVVLEKLSVPPLHSLRSSFGRTGCNSFKGSKKRDEGSNENSNGESAKETILAEMRVSG